MNAAATSPRKTMTVGRSIELTELHIVCLHDPESGQVLHRHTVAVVKGGQDVGEDAAVKQALARTKAFHASIEKDAAEMKKMAAKGQSLFPIDRLKVAVSNDPMHLEMELRVDPKSGKLVEAPDEDRRPPSRRTRQSR